MPSTLLLHEASDDEIIDAAAASLAVPRVGPADSFVLHAPLELLARAALLAYVEPERRDLARERIAWLAATYTGSGPAFEAPPGERTDLVAALDAGDLDGVDRAATALAGATTAEALSGALADAVLPRLGAAAHGSILLYLLPRVLPRSAAAAVMARGLLRELARHPAWRVEWIDDRSAAGGPSGDLAERLLAPPSPGDPGSNFIYPTMSLVDRSGLAEDLLDAPTRGLPVPEARRDLLRVAAWSMLQDDPAHAPYGWSHCLTMPQATLGIADRCSDPGRAVAVAATYVLGFRATLGRVALDPAWVPADPGPDDTDADRFLGLGPRRAAAAVWHASPHEFPGLVRRVVTYAALHEDAHLAKYVLACLDAGRDDPAAGHLYAAAAAHLAAWWHEASAVNRR